MPSGKRNIPYLVSTALLSAMMLVSAVLYFANHAHVAEEFGSLGFPTYIIYPLAIAKVLGVIAIWNRGFPTLRGLAYAGFFYDFILAASGHLMAGDDDFAGPLVALVLLGVSYFTGGRSRA